MGSSNANTSVLYFENGSLYVRLYDLSFTWFSDMLQKVPQDLDLASVLRERALQYDGCDVELKQGRRNIASASLNYIQVSNIEMNISHKP